MGDRVILHSDINCCYASIEHLHHPELAGKPLAVGGDPEARHGIVLTADYIAKKYGVKTGMALWQAKQVCPDITFVSPRMDLYLRFSRMAHEIYAEYTDRQEPYGIDECWLDVTGSSSLKGDVVGKMTDEDLVHQLRTAGVNHCLSFEQVCDEWIEEYQITEGNFDNITTCKYSVPTVTSIGRVYQTLILNVMGLYANVVEAIKTVYNSFISDEISDFNSNVFYSNPDYIKCSYEAGELLD